MSAFFEIAYAAASNRLCLFTGTGFSKAVTENAAPSWQGLLEVVCDLFDDPDSYKNALFPDDDKNALNLEEAAQILSIGLQRIDRNIYEEVASQIDALTPSANISAIAGFMSSRSFRVITTNYDKLIEQMAGESECHSLAPSLPIPRSQARVKVFHVHGSTDSPENMVITSDDYFRFLNRESYFSRKLSTVLHENTVVILGYSLGDTNLKSILSDYRGFSRTHIIGSNIFLVSRSEIDQHIKDYHAHSYGIRVLDGIEVSEFFENLNSEIPNAERCTESSIENIRKVVFDGKIFTQSYLKLESSFFEIIASIGAIGLSIEDDRVVKTIGQIVDGKTDLTREHNAWEQYEHLARWLVYLGSILEIEGTSIQELFLSSVLRSMNTMRRELYIGYSWHAYKSWSRGWEGVIASNRLMIKRHVEANTSWPDALAIVGR